MTPFIRRADWDARYPDGFGDRPLPVTEFWLHHSVTMAPDLVPPFTDDDAAIRTLEQIGQSRFGGGISYTFPVTPVGRLYEGHSLHRRGAHTKGHNTVAAAFCLVGNYDTLTPTRAQKVAIASKMVELHRAGLATRHTLNGGHRDVFGTACPGAKGYAAIGEINRIANAMWDGATFDVGTSAGDVWQPAGDWTTKDVQQLLGLTQDGVYGAATTAAVRALQQDLDLTADGLWGPSTEGVIVTALDNIQTDLKRLLTGQGNLDRDLADVERWTRQAVNNSLWAGPTRTAEKIAAEIAKIPGVNLEALAAHLASELGDDVRAAVAGVTGADPDAIAKAVADEVGKRLAGQQE